MERNDRDSPAGERARRRRLRGRTVVELFERADGTWIATQAGVDVEGRGESAAKAVASYGESIADDDSEGERVR